MRKVNKHTTGGKNKEKVLTNFATGVVSVSSTGSELVLSVTKRAQFSVVNV